MNIFKSVLRSKLFLPFILFATTSLFTSILFFAIEHYSNANVNNFFDALWWSIVTMSTTGYGTVIPTSWLGRIVAIVAIMFGILATSLLTGTIASVYLNQISRTRSGLMSFNKIRGHIVICGWRNDMADFLQRIIKKERISMDKLIVVADPEQEKVDAIFETEGLDNFKFVRGNFYEKTILAKANIKSARKAMVLADQTAVRTDFEVDSRTVMTVISLKTLNKNIHVSAQLLEKNFEVYLQRAKCDEIIYSKVLNTELLSLIVEQDGMSNVITALVGREEGNCHLQIEPIKTSFVEKTFQELRSHLTEQIPNILVLGILENTGKQHEITNEAIRHAQQTADFPDMLQKLRNVQNIKAFKPVMIPADDYLIPRHSSVILLEKNHG